MLDFDKIDRESQWLFQKVMAEDRDSKPEWARKGLSNWIKVLNTEIQGEHGGTPRAQFESCREQYASVKQKGTSISFGTVFEAMFAAVNYSMSVASLNQQDRPTPWSYAPAIIAWYYSYYNAMRAFLMAAGMNTSDTHSWVYRKGLNEHTRGLLPHPLNMVARRVKNEEYELILPAYPEIEKVNLNLDLEESRSQARGMLLSYLNGTTGYYGNEVKERVKQKCGFDNFLTKKARNVRNNRLDDEVNFMHCAFRYRGKANYRDAIFLSYGPEDPILEGFMSALMSTAQFAFIFALAYLERRIGPEAVTKFLVDIGDHMRGIGEATNEEHFWSEFTDIIAGR